MARRQRQSSHKALGPGHRSRNKNPKLSPFQREQKRHRLANAAPRPFVNASANQGKVKATGGLTADALNPVLMYQKRDAPAKARGLMQYLQDKEERAIERKRLHAQALLRQQQEEAADAEARLAYRERNEGSDDEEADEEDFDGEEDEVEEEEDMEFDADEEDESVDASDDESLIDTNDEMSAMLADLKAAKKKKNPNNSDSESDISDDDDFANKHKKKVEGGKGVVLTRVPSAPSNKQLKAWMIKKDFVAYAELKNKGDTKGADAILKRVLEGHGYKFMTSDQISNLKQTRKDTAAAAIAAKAEAFQLKQEAKAAAKNANGGKRLRVKPVLEGELSTKLEDANEDYLAKNIPANMATVMLGNSDTTMDAHAAFAAETAMQNLKLLKKKEKKHAKKSEKRREKTMEEVAEIEDQLDKAMSKTHKKKVKKERIQQGDENYRRHQQLAEMQLANLRAGIGAKRMREEGAEGDGHDPNYLLPYQEYEQQQQLLKNQVKRLSSMNDSQLSRLGDMDDKVKLIEKIQLHDRAEAPPVFSVVPSMTNSFSKFAVKLQTDASKKPESVNPNARKVGARVNGVVVASNGGIRAQQKKPGKVTANKLAAKGLLKQAYGAVSTAARTDDRGDMSLYERKRLAKLGLMGPVTEQRISRSSVVNGGEGNASHNASEMELLRQRVIDTYRQNQRNQKKQGSHASTASKAQSVEPLKSWMPTDRDY